ncbi:MAG: group II intron reverse transcriptase/maturase [Limnochordia bacterium]|nr:group II intron reverse transcriptase/maturase [Limnochordia bacterium]
MRKWYSLIDKVYALENLRQAFKHVKSNKGAPGVDEETVEDFALQLEKKLNKIHVELKTDTYEPSPVKRVEIEKDDGSKRPLGIPTVTDRVVQQALRQVIEPIFEPDFHPSSYGYRPNRSCQKAVAKAEQFLRRYGLTHVVDMDLSKCFDTLDHELIIQGVNKKISDGRILKLIRQYLTAGVLADGAIQETEIGSPQGGVISPLLANICLNEFDQKMKAKGIRIVRYADDILVLAKSPRQAKKHQDIASQILEDDLKLTVNRAKTHITSLSKGVSYLGFVIYPKCIVVDPKRVKRFKDKIRRLTPRNHGKNVEQQIAELNRFLRGWVNYFRIANIKNFLKDTMGWIRRRLRMKQMREWKSWKKLHRTLRQKGYQGEFEKISMFRWRNSASPLLSMALPNIWFEAKGLIDLTTYEVGIVSRFYESC